MSENLLFPLLLLLCIQLALSAMMSLVFWTGFALHASVRNDVGQRRWVAALLVATVPWSLIYVGRQFRQLQKGRQAGINRLN